MAAVCPHGFPLPATRYGDVLRPPNACHCCRSDDSFGAAIRWEGSFSTVTDQAFGEGPWNSGETRFTQNDSYAPNVQGCHGLNGFEQLPPEPLQAQARTFLPQTQALRQSPKPPGPSHYHVLFPDDNKNSHVATRRGPLTEGGRENIKRLRTKGGACWRCKVLKKQCDGETPCKECSTGESRKWHLGCKRGQIRDDIKGMIPDFFALGTGEWFMSSEDGIKDQYRIRITYDNLDPKSVIRDCKHLAGEVTSSTLAELSILDFVEQFYDVDSRGPEMYKPTSEFLKKCARLQADIISDASFDPGGPSKELIALSLRCFMLAWNFSLGDESVWEHHRFGNENPMKYKTSNGLSVEIFKLETADKQERHTYDRINGKSFSQSLEELLQLTQNLIMRRKPKDWPIVLCTLCLLHRIWEEFFQTGTLDSLYGPNLALYSLFEITSKGLHPLCSKWNKEAYSRLVDGNDVLVKTFQWIHDQWLEGCGMDVPDDLCLADKIDVFFNGF